MLVPAQVPFAIPGIPPHRAGNAQGTQGQGGASLRGQQSQAAQGGAGQGAQGGSGQAAGWAAGQMPAANAEYLQQVSHALAHTQVSISQQLEQSLGRLTDLVAQMQRIAEEIRTTLRTTEPERR